MPNNSAKIALLGFTAFFCLSGQIPRKEVEEVPSTQCVTGAEVQKEKMSQQHERQSAAKKSMQDNGQTTMNRKSAAKNAMKREE